MTTANEDKLAKQINQMLMDPNPGQEVRHDFPMYEHLLLDEDFQKHLAKRFAELGIRKLGDLDHGYSSLVFDLGNRQCAKLMPESHVQPVKNILRQVPALKQFVLRPQHTERLDIQETYDPAVGKEHALLQIFPKVRPIEIISHENPYYQMLRWELTKIGVNVPDLMTNIGLLLDSNNNPIHVRDRMGKERCVPVLLDAGAATLLDPVLEQNWIKQIKRETKSRFKDLDIWDGQIERTHPEILSGVVAPQTDEEWTSRVPSAAEKANRSMALR